MIDLLISYLGHRLQRVCVSDLFSIPLAVISGVPQGSILRPLLYTIYPPFLNDCLRSCKFTYLYADNSWLYISFFPSDADVITDMIDNDLEILLFFLLVTP